MALDQLGTFMAAIRRIESGSYRGNYGAIGPYTGSLGRARGAYQIMEANWSGWAAQAGIPGADWRSPTAQDVVARHKFGEYYNRYGSWELVAVAWFAGPGTANRLAQGDNSVLSISDVLGSSVGGYINKLRSYMADPDNPAGAVGDDDVAERNRFRSIADRAGVEPPPELEAGAIIPSATGQVPVYDSEAMLRAYLEQLQAGQESVAAEDDPDAARRATRNRLLRMVQAMSNAVREGSGINVGATADVPLLEKETEGEFETIPPMQLLDPLEDPPLRGRGY